MGQKLVIGPIDKGIRTDRTAFNIDNDSFPQLINAYQWRGRIKRKRGTQLLGRLNRFFDSTNGSYTPLSPPYFITLDEDGNGNLLTGTYANLDGTASFSLQAINGNIIPGSVTLEGSVGPVEYTDPTMDGFLTPTGTGGNNTINYATGAIHIPDQASGNITAIFTYYPDLPVMGLEALVLHAQQFPGTLAFDTTYSYNISTSSPYNIYDVSFYKNPNTDSTNLPSYVRKTDWTDTTWNGQDYQQFWTVNYQGALWATNGIKSPTDLTNIGMQYKIISNVQPGDPGPPATANIQINAHGLSVGDFLFINEVLTTTGINFQTGYVIAILDANSVTVKFPNTTIANNGTGGIAQYLTNRSDVTKDCIRWYDGDPTGGTPPSPSSGNGWVNFAPPLEFSTVSIDDAPIATYYLVGAKLIFPFKDRLLFFGPVIQTSSPNSQIYLQDTVIYSQNGTPYYTCSFDGSNPRNVLLPNTLFHPILTPNANASNYQTATANSYFCDISGFGGFITAGTAQPIISVGRNEDVLIVGFTNAQTRLVYTSNDLIPFNFFTINSELGSGSTFSTITLDRGVITTGDHGIQLTSQVSSQRIDLELPDQVFQFNLSNNGADRVTAQRDFSQEWIYFTYSGNNISYKFPDTTLQYNYRDNSWAIFYESYTTYGQFRRSTGYTWNNIGETFLTWEQWNQPWNSGSTTLFTPEVIGGNQQGFILIRNEGTGEGNSLYIQNISGSTITSPNHCLNQGDYIIISGCIGTISSQVNGKIFSVATPIDNNTFVLNPTIGSGTYSGGGVIQRMYIPFVQTKQFPSSWDTGRKTRIGVQQYLLSTTSRGQITLYIYLSQNSDIPYNKGPIYPDVNSQNNSLIYNTVLYTCPESTNLGLTTSNINLQMPTSSDQEQIWHRINTSLIGDTVQLAFTMSDAQMRDATLSNQFSEIEIHSIILDTSPSMMLS